MVGVEKVSIHEHVERLRYRKRLKDTYAVRKVMMQRVCPGNPQIPAVILSPEKIVAVRWPSSKAGQLDLFPFLGSSINRKLNEKILENKKNADEMQKAERAEVDVINGRGQSAIQCNLFRDAVQCKEVERVCAGRSADSDSPRVRTLSSRSKRKIREKITAFYSAAKKHCTFVTLSFVRAVSDGTAVKILNKFLTQIRKDLKRLCQPEKFNYLWVIERQTDNEKFPDNPHFHLIIDRRLDVDRYNSLWVVQQYNAGLRGYSKKLGREVYAEEIAEAHRLTMDALFARDFAITKQDKEKHTDRLKRVKIGRWLNPFDIKQINGVDRLSAYLTSYITKNKAEFACATWHCSRGVSEIYTRFLASQQALHDAASEEINFTVDEKTGEWFGPAPIRVVTKKADAVVVWLLNKKYFDENYFAALHQLNRWVLYEGYRPSFGKMTHEVYASKYYNSNEQPDIFNN